MYRRVRRAASAVSLAQRALNDGQLDGEALSLALGACARAYWLRSAVALWRDASRRGVHVRVKASGVRALQLAARGSQHEAEIASLIAQSEENATLAHRNVVASLPERFLQLPLMGLGAE